MPFPSPLFSGHLKAERCSPVQRASPFLSGSLASVQMIISIWWCCSQLRGSWLWCSSGNIMILSGTEWEGEVQWRLLSDKDLGTPFTTSRSIWRCLFNKCHSKNFPEILAKLLQLTRPQFAHLSNGITILALASCWSSTPALKLSWLGGFGFPCGAILSSVYTNGSTPSLRSWMKSHLLREVCLN